MTTENRSLVLVVGAGASKEANLPLGVELKAKIANLLDIRFEGFNQQISGDINIAQALGVMARQKGGPSANINPYLQKCWMIREGMPVAASIDNFIDAHRDDEMLAQCAKLGIAGSILEAEARSLLMADRKSSNPTINLKVLEKTWYSSFFKILVEGCKLSDLPDRLSRIAIITFNYDRCIETFLNAALCDYYSIGARAANDLLKELVIYHPYGFIGDLLSPASQPHLEFGITPHPTQLVQLIERIKTFTEGTDEEKSDIRDIRNLIDKTERLAFIGFAFHKQNLKLLYGDRKPSQNGDTRVYGTSHGISETDAEFITRELITLGRYKEDNVKLKNLDCVSFFHEFGRGLSLTL